MMLAEFESYLMQRFPHPTQKGTRGGARSRCNRIEAYEGNIDGHYDRDRMHDLILRLEYSKEDESFNRPPRHNIPIKGKKKSSVREGTASLKDAAKLYRDFRDGVMPESQTPRVTTTTASTSQMTSTMTWPEWERPSMEDIYALLAITAKHMRFLSPEIVSAIVEDNGNHVGEWTQQLESCGVDANSYLWSGSSCSFPGIRRHSGRAEIQDFSRRDFSNLTDALATDDNSYPKQIWAFTFTGKKFVNFGPSGYRLAHLLDHKGGARFAEEVQRVKSCGAVPGLYTAASNSAYICEELIDPTDFNALARRVIQQHASNLYGDVCEILPPGFSLQIDSEIEALASELPWANPVGTMDPIPAFLKWRLKTMRSLFDQASNRRF